MLCSYLSSKKNKFVSGNKLRAVSGDNRRPRSAGDHDLGPKTKISDVSHTFLPDYG